MELEEAIEMLKDFIKYYEAEATARKFRGSITIVVDEDDIEAIERVLKYIKEESIPRAVIEEKIEEIDYSYKNIEKNYTEEQLDNYDVGEDDYIEMKKIEFAMSVLKKILNKGE